MKEREKEKRKKERNRENRKGNKLPVTHLNLILRNLSIASGHGSSASLAYDATLQSVRYSHLK